MYEVDISILISNNITVKEYLFCKMIQNENAHLLLKYMKIDPIDISWIDNLISRGWIKGNANQITSLSVTPKFKNIGKHLYHEDMFDEFYKLYPAKVIRPEGGYGYLRTDKKNCKLRYDRITKGKRLTHDLIMDALRKEIEIRTKKNTLKFFKSMPNWLKSEEWQTTLEILADEVSMGDTTTKTYGTDLL